MHQSFLLVKIQSSILVTQFFIKLHENNIAWNRQILKQDSAPRILLTDPSSRKRSCKDYVGQKVPLSRLISNHDNSSSSEEKRKEGKKLLSLAVVVSF